MLLNEIKEKYPIHYLVWNNEADELDKALKENKYDIEALDPRKRTPLMLAVVLTHIDCIKLLLAAKSNTCVETNGWTISQEAVATGNPDIIEMVIAYRDMQRQKSRSIQVPALLEKLKNSPDFYVEMKWEFSSWIPLMSRICPSDTYKVFKSGSFVRIDTTLIGFDQTSWQRGNRSYLFKGGVDEANFYEIDHDAKTFSMEVMKDLDVELFENGIPPTRDAITMRLQAPVISNMVDIDKISFERNKSGWFAWKNEKNESVNNYDCRVYNASNVEFITKTRTEHLNESQSRLKNSRTPLQHFLGLADENNSTYEQNSPRNSPSPVPEANGGEIAAAVVEGEAPTIEEYFSDMDLYGRDVGKPKKISTKIQKFKANLWLSDSFPIKLQEQILPILDLMSTLASPHVSKLKDFITMQLPSGFPVKVEIPLFHVLNALITFGNVFALENSVEHVSNVNDDNNDRLTCVIDDACFEVPASYENRTSAYRRQVGYDDEDELMEYAIRQSLLDAGSENDEVDIWEALKCQRPITPNYGFPVDDETQQLQRALQESLLYSQITRPSPTEDEDDDSKSDSIDENLELALRLSRAQKLKEMDLLQEENRMIELAIKMSLEES